MARSPPPDKELTNNRGLKRSEVKDPARVTGAFPATGSKTTKTLARPRPTGPVEESGAFRANGLRRTPRKTETFCLRSRWHVGCLAVSCTSPFPERKEV